MMFCWCTLVLLTLVPVVTGNNSGVKLKLTQKGLDLVAGKAIEKVKQHIQDMDIPDQTVSVIKQYTATGIKIHLNVLTSMQNFLKDTGVNIQMYSPRIQVTGNLISGELRSPINVNVETLVITATVAVKVDGTGHLKLSIEDCKTEIGTFTADRTGSWLVDGVSWLFSVLPSIAGKLVCSMMKTILNTQLATLNDKVREFTGFDFSVASAVISKDSIELSFVGLNGRKKRRLLEETKALLRINI